MTEATNDLSPVCCICGRHSATVQLVSEADGVRFIYEGLERGNASGDIISPARAREIRFAFTLPVTAAKLLAADLHRGNTGFCTKCSLFYCSAHWKISSTGGGICPEGHFETLDPHWSPDD
jgi:hypothetical protein